MKENIILFIVDSLNYYRVRKEPRLMPFLQSLKNRGIYSDSVFSEAPYTEAAVMNIYCGQDVLQDGGYLFRFKNTKLTIFEAMKQKGYQTYFNSFQPQCYASSLRRGVDCLYYNVGFDLDALWSYRLSHYCDLLKKKSLEDSDYQVLFIILDDNFSEWIRFTDALIDNDPSVDMIKDNDPNYDPVLVKSSVLIEQKKYDKDKYNYVHDLLKQGKRHSLFQIPSFNQTCKIENREFLDLSTKLFLPVFKRIRKRLIFHNVFDFFELFVGPVRKMKQFVISPSKDKFKNFCKSCYLSFDHIWDIDLFKRLGSNSDSFKNAPSARTHINHFANWLSRERDVNQPFFSCIHVDDVHNPEVFFTYDSDDIQLLQKELFEIENTLDAIPNTFRGSISHDLSLRYIDGVIEYLYNVLKDRNLDNNTQVVICADHGFSFSGFPLRDSFVVNLYLENYNIPFFITGYSISKHIEGLFSSKDIPSTICYIADGVIPKEFSGKNIINDTSRESLPIEYCGGGCPDILRRYLKVASFDSTYFVGVYGRLSDLSLESSISEIYDLEKDPLQKNNIVSQNHNRKKVLELFENIKIRQKEILSTLKY